MKNRGYIIIILTILIVSILNSPDVLASDEAINKVTIISSDLEKKEVLGFEYLLVNLDTGKEIPVSFLDRAKVELSVEDGSYVLKQTKTIEGYEKEADINFSLPSRIDENTFSREAILLTKHILEPTITLEAKDNPKTSDNFDFFTNNLYILAAATVGLTLTKYSLRKQVNK